MNFDNAANAMWVGGEGFDGAHTVGARAVIELYHAAKNDIWDWKDLHMGPAGKHCGGTDMPQGAALAGCAAPCSLSLLHGTAQPSDYTVLIMYRSS